MDFTNRNQQSPARPGMAFSAGSDEQPAAGAPAPKARGPRSGGDKGSNKYKWYRWGGGIMVIIVGLLLAAVVAYLLTAKPASEDNYVDSSKLQAVFLTNDQVYFGNVTSLNKQYLVLDNIYYLQSSNTGSKATTTNSNVSLVKLGCELHKPYDQMVINRSEVEFWENLKSDGQVAKAVAQYQKANPNGQTCSTNPSSNPVQGSSSTTNNSTTPNNATTNNATKQ
jgi:hypothetical protein